jgi:hypothetical protein
VPVAALLRAYRIGSAKFQDWCLHELGRRSADAAVVSAAGLRIAGTTNAYIDLVSEEIVSGYEAEKENWLRNQSVARAARVRALLRGEPVDVTACEAVLGYRLRQHHLGVVTWTSEVPPGADALGLLERATSELATAAGCEGRPLFVPQDESAAWAWLPLGARSNVPGLVADADPQVRFAFGEPGTGPAGFRRTHQQALSAQAVAVAAAPPGPRMIGFADVAPLALMSGSLELLRACDDEHNARLRDTLRVFLEENGSYKATAERLTLHKNTVQYRVRRAEESLARPVDQDRLRVELALLAARWLGATVLQPVTGNP